MITIIINIRNNNYFNEKKGSKNLNRHRRLIMINHVARKETEGKKGVRETILTQNLKMHLDELELKLRGSNFFIV